MTFPDLFRDDVFRVETTRLWLRWPRAADAVALDQVARSAAVAEMTATWPHPLPETEADWRILRARESNASGDTLVLAITRKRAGDQLVGVLGLTEAGDRALELGFMLGNAHQGRGIMTEAVKGLATVVFTGSSASLIRASSRTINPASRRVLEKAGFTRTRSSMIDAPARGGAIEVDEFELSRAAWLRSNIQARSGRDRAPQPDGRDTWRVLNAVA